MSQINMFKWEKQTLSLRGGGVGGAVLLTHQLTVILVIKSEFFRLKMSFLNINAYCYPIFFW